MAYMPCSQRIDDEQFIYNEPVNVKKFIQSWTEMSNFDFAGSKSEDEHIKVMMNLDEETMSQFNERCGLEILKCGSEDLLRHQSINYFPEDIDLVSTKLQKMNMERRQGCAVYRNFMCRKHRLRELYQDVLSPLNLQPSPENRVVTPDALLQVALYKPIKKGVPFSTRIVSHGNANLENVYAVIGQQKLSALRDRIRCVNDVLVTGDFSEKPDLDTNICTWDVFKSGTFLIEDTFYDDTRQPDNLRYSKEIIEWAAKSDMVYQAKIMEDTRFDELTVRIGCPYLYLHQGNCEHLMIFTDVRMIHPHDNLNQNEYPCLLRRPRKKRTICCVCAYASARWRTVDSEHALESTSFFCDVCFRSLHYDKHGNKLGDFKAYKYFDGHTVI